MKKRRRACGLSQKVGSVSVSAWCDLCRRRAGERQGRWCSGDLDAEVRAVALAI